MFGEILDGAFRTVRRNAGAMFGSAVLVQMLSAAAGAALLPWMMGFMFRAAMMEQEPSAAELNDFMSQVLSVVGVGVAISIVFAFLSAVLQGVMAVPVARSVLNRRTRFSMMWSLARKRIRTLAAIAALMMLAFVAAVAVTVGLGVLLVMGGGPPALLPAFFIGLGVVVVGVWLYVKVSVAPAAAVVEDIGALEAISRSWNLTRFNWWRILGISLVAAIIVNVIGQVVLMPIQLAMQMIFALMAPHGGIDEAMAGFGAATVAALVVGALVGALGFAFQTSVNALLYMDLRMRHEGLDVELLRLLETGADADGIPGRYGARAT